MVLGWAMAQGTLNAMLAALTATVPDQVPSRQRGAVGGWLAIAQTVGVVAGSAIAAVTGSIAAGYLTIAGVLVVLSLPYCLDSRDIALDPALREPFEIGPFVRSFWVSPRAHPDFAWAWITRFLMNLGNALVILYLLYYLKDAVDLTDKEAERGVALLTAVYGALRGADRGARRHLVRPARPPQDLRDRLRPGRRGRAPAARLRHDLARRLRRRGGARVSGSASTPPSTSR